MKAHFLTLWLLGVLLYPANAENSTSMPPVDIRLTGRLLLDGGFFLQSPEELHSGTHIPDVRLGAKITITPGWYTKIDVGFANGKASLKDAYVEYAKNGNYYRAGYMLGFYSIDQSASTNDLVFHTPANSADTFYPGRHVGLSFTRSVTHYYFSLGAFMGDKINYPETTSPGTNLSARLVWRPVNDGLNLVHIGSGMAFRVTDKEEETGKRSLSLKTKGVTAISIPFLLDMDFEDTRNQLQNNIEGMVYHGKWLFQSELMTMRIKQKNQLNDFFAWGGYLQCAYLIKGKRYAYDQIDALPVMPVEPHTLMLVARFNVTDLNNSKNEWYGGCQKDFSLGLNYYFNNYISTRLNYNFINTDIYSALGKNNIHMMQVRLQVRF